MKRFWSLLFILTASLACADGVIIRITAENPDRQARAVEVKSVLPVGIRKGDILRTSGLNVTYDVRRAAYYVHATLQLDAGEERSLDVEVRDIWSIPAGDLDELQAHVGAAVLLLRSADRRKEGAALANTIREALRLIRERQDANALPQATVEEHIQAFVENQPIFFAALEKVASLEELVLGDGRDPGMLLGRRSTGPRPALPAAEPHPGRAQLLVAVNNPSPTETRVLDVQHYLPREITASDVLDPGSLEVRTDVGDGLCYLFKKAVSVPPMQVESFTVVLKDRWNVHGPRIARLEQSAIDELNAVKKWVKYRSVERRLGRAISAIRELGAMEPPATVNEDYVAFFRDQARVLNGIEQDIRWVQTLKRNGVVGPPLGEPTRKAVWMIIWIILGFLAVVTLLVLAHSQKHRYT